MSFFSAEDLPTFPVIDRLLVGVKERVNLAREIDKLELTHRRDISRNGWLQKAAKEMDILLDDNEFYSTDDVDAVEKAALKKTLKTKKNQLENLIEKPLFPKNFSGKYLDVDLNISLSQNTQKAIEIMKQAVNEFPKLKKESAPKESQKSKRALKRKKQCENTSIKKIKP